VSFITGTQVECLYSMPASGAAVTAAAATCLSGTTAANPPYLLPGGFFAPQSGTTPGKSILIKGGGTFSVGTSAVTDIFTVALDPTQNSTTSQIVLAKTGTFTTLVSWTTAAFDFEVMITATALGAAAGGGSFNCVGSLSLGAGNNLAAPTLGTMGTSTTASLASKVMIGAPNTPLAFTTATPYYLELWNTWSATTGSPTITLTNFYVFGLN
jgi:hypothetical protein